MSLYEELLEEVRKNSIDHGKIETLLKEIKAMIANGEFPSREDFLLFVESLKIIEAKSLILKENLDKLKLRRKVTDTYKP